MSFQPVFLPKLLLKNRVHDTVGIVKGRLWIYECNRCSIAGQMVSNYITPASISRHPLKDNFIALPVSTLMYYHYFVVTLSLKMQKKNKYLAILVDQFCLIIFSIMLIHPEVLPIYTVPKWDNIHLQLFYYWTNTESTPILTQVNCSFILPKKMSIHRQQVFIEVVGRLNILHQTILKWVLQVEELAF